MADKNGDKLHYPCVDAVLAQQNDSVCHKNIRALQLPSAIIFHGDYLRRRVLGRYFVGNLVTLLVGFLALHPACLEFEAVHHALLLILDNQEQVACRTLPEYRGPSLYGGV